MPTRFARLPKNYWADPENRRKFFDDLAVDLGLKHLDDWYNITVEQFKKQSSRKGGGSGILSRYYGNSLSAALKALYPEHPWQEQRFSKAPQGYWRNRENQRRFFDAIAPQLGVSNVPEDWYKVTVEDVKKARLLPASAPSCSSPAAGSQVVGSNADGSSSSFGGAHGILRHYNGSLAAALQAAYPEHTWHVWKFSRIPHHHHCHYHQSKSKSKSREAEGGDNDGQEGNHGDVEEEEQEEEEERWLREWLEAFAREMRIEQLDDWYRVSTEQVRQSGGYALVRRNGGSLYAVLRRVYPDHDWDPARFLSKRAKKASQRWIKLLVEKMFPNEEVKEDYHHPALGVSGMELDIFVPSRSLALEYQGAQHYRDVPFLGSHSAADRGVWHNDAQKAELCKQAGITLVTIPYWMVTGTVTRASSRTTRATTSAPSEESKFNKEEAIINAIREALQ